MGLTHSFILHRLAGSTWRPPPCAASAVDFTSGQRLLAQHAEALLGPASDGRAVRIMVTMPAEAADDYTLVHALHQQGMDCMRIHCAHDDAATWSRMIDHLRRAEQALGRHCRVVMDLAGPKLRTGPLEPGPEVTRVRPPRDVFGQVTAPPRVWLTAREEPCSPPSPADACLSLPASWLQCLRSGGHVKFRDARAARRRLTIEGVNLKYRRRCSGSARPPTCR